MRAAAGCYIPERRERTVLSRLADTRGSRSESGADPQPWAACTGGKPEHLSEAAGIHAVEDTQLGLSQSYLPQREGLHMHTFVRRLAAVVISSAVAGASTLAGAPAQAAPNSYAASAATWLTSQLTHGLVHNRQYDTDDYGLSLDAYFALEALGRPRTAASILRAVDNNPAAYVGAGAERYAGATGKLATAVELAGRDLSSFGGVDLRARLEGLVNTKPGAQLGRASDVSRYGDFANTIGQGWVVRALGGEGSALTDEATGFLVKQQCGRGFFRETFEKTTASSSFTCDAAVPAATPSVDSTALALQALLSARFHGVGGLDDNVTRAARWLVAHQHKNGSFVGNGSPNTNTTGLAAAALAAAGRTAAAERAAAYVSRLQVTRSLARRSPRLRHAVGAIAYDRAALATARKAGIPVDQQDQWRRATAQAAIGVNAVRIVRVGTPAHYVHGGSRVAVHLAGLRSRERYTLRLGTVQVVQGTASRTGGAWVRVSPPRVTSPFRVRVTGSASARTGTGILHVLGPRRFRAVLASRHTHRGGVNRVTVTRMSSHEPVRLYYRGSRIWSGRASATGRLVRSFHVGRALGPRTLRVAGAFRDRSVTTTVRVVR